MDHQEMMESDQQSLEGMLMSPAKPQQESPVKKPRPQPEQAPECPRCESTNTKFCYYNNYSLSQPRYFCKSCRRYWTKGGTLRNVPVGGGCRKSKRATSSSKRISIAATTQHRDHQHSDHQHSDSNVPLTALDNLAYEASNLGESFHLPLIFAHQLHHKFPDRQIDGYDFPMGEGFIGAPSMDNLQGLCFGLGDGAMGEADTDRGIGGESMLPYKEMKLDHFCSGENAVLLGCPWPLMGGDGISNPGNLGSIGGSWDDTGFSSSLHSLVNSPLM